MASSADRQTRRQYSSSPELSEVPSAISALASPAGNNNHDNPNKLGDDMDSITVDHSVFRIDSTGQPLLTKDGHPRKKPGPKPGTKVNRPTKVAVEASSVEAKPKKTRKPKDPNAPQAPRKRKLAATDPDLTEANSRATSVGAGPAKAGDMTLGRAEAVAQPTGAVREAIQLPDRESMGVSKMLNDEPAAQAQPQQQPRHSLPTARTSGTNYDPIRSNYDPVRETMVQSYSGTLPSPRGANVNRASASPSISSLVDPPASLQNILSPAPQHVPFAGSSKALAPPLSNYPPPPSRAKPATTAAKKPMSATVNVTKAQIEIKSQCITTIGAGSKRTPPKKKATTPSSSPAAGAQKDSLAPMPDDGLDKSILNFGRTDPRLQRSAPSIVLHIPLNGETNKYINFARMAEEEYGWEALHPHQAESRARKARIAEAASALAQADPNRDSDDAMSADISEESHLEMAGVDGQDKGVRVQKKKRHFKEDEYDKQDDFVDDSEMLWEEQAAASKDGFFVYSGPLIPEVEAPAVGRADGPKRGKGSRGGRGATARGGAAATRAGRGGGTGARGGATRKPRMTKADKAQMDREKAAREATFIQSTGGGNYSVLQPGSPQPAGL